MKKLHLILSLILVAVANITTAQKQNPVKYQVGKYEVILFSDGANQGNAKLLIGATPEMIQETMPDSIYPTAINYFLVKTPEKKYLLDTGLGKNIEANLYKSGISPDGIHTIILTHLHGDHTGGLLKDGNKFFPNAVIQMSEAEKKYWTNDISMSLAPDDRRKSFLSVRKTLQPYETQTKLVTPGKAELPEEDGLFFIEAYGHTPGHMAVLLQSEGKRLLIWGDLTHAMAIQMPYPEVALTYDINPEAAIESRKEILEFVTRHQIPVAGMHMPYPAIGTIESNSKGGYAFSPIQ